MVSTLIQTSGWRVLLLVLLVLLALAHVTSLPALVQADDREADVRIVLEANPNLYVIPGAQLALKLRVENYDDSGTMAYARAWMDYDSSLVTMQDTYFDNIQDDYVVSIDEQRILLHFGEVGSNAARFAVLYMKVNDNLAPGTVINMQVGYTWEDKHGNYELNQKSNPAPVIVGETNVTSPYLWMGVEPTYATVGTTIGFYTNRLLPGEKIRIYLRSADGTMREMLTNDARVSPNNELWLNLETDDLAPGTYDYIVRGRESRLETLATFTLVPPE